MKTIEQQALYTNMVRPTKRAAITTEESLAESERKTKRFKVVKKEIRFKRSHDSLFQREKQLSTMRSYIIDRLMGEQSNILYLPILRVEICFCFNLYATNYTV